MNFSHAADTRLLISERVRPWRGSAPTGRGAWALPGGRGSTCGADRAGERRAGAGRCNLPRRLTYPGSSLTRGPVARWLRAGGRCTSSSASRNGRAPALRQARGIIVPRGGAALRPPEAALRGGAAAPVPRQQVPRLGHGDARYKAAAGRGRPALTAPCAYRRAAAANGAAAPPLARPLATGRAAEGAGRAASPCPRRLEPAAAPGDAGGTWSPRRPGVCAGAGQPRRAAGHGRPARRALPAGLCCPPQSRAGHSRPQPRRGQ